MRDMHVLLHELLTPQLVMLVPLDQLDRRLNEITAQQPRFIEEAPLLLAGEAGRRRRLNGLRVVREDNQFQVA